MKFPNSSAFQLAIAYAFVAFAPFAQSQQQCPVGIEPVTTGKQCPCVTVDAGCIVTDSRTEYDDIRGKKCDGLNVRADDNGNYPTVDVKYTWSMCNENAFDIELRDPQAKMYDWTEKKGDKAKNVANPRIPLGGLTLPSGECIETDVDLNLSTANRYNVATQLEGFVLDRNGNRKSSKTDYCYAYYSDLINIKRGLCIMETDASCKVAGTNQECQEFIDANPECVDFDAEFNWQACNREPRDMIVLSEASNVKIARVDPNGVTFNDRFARVKDLGRAGSPTDCESFGPEIRTYNTCSHDRVFFSINVQGTNEKGKYWYECQDFTFKKLAFNPIPAPTLSPFPSLSQTPSFSQKPSFSQAPTSSTEPSVSQHPSLSQEPSQSQHPSISAAPSLSQKPSLSQEPTFSQIPSLSQKPSLSQEPSISQAPSVSHEPSLSQVPSVSQDPTLSQKPTMSQAPSVSQEPSLSQQPSISQAPSLSQGPSLSQEPSSSQAPSVSQEPSMSQVPSVSQEPTLSQQPSASQEPSLSQVPSVSQEPSASQAPSASQEPSFSQQPTLSQAPTISQEPSISQKPSVSQAPSVSQEPSLSQQPSLSLLPSLSQQPSVSQKPSFSHAPSISQKPSQQGPAPQPSPGKGKGKGKGGKGKNKRRSLSLTQ